MVDVRPFGCFIEFDVEADAGDKHKVYGMVHVSEVSWDYSEDARLLVKVLLCTYTPPLTCGRLVLLPFCKCGAIGV